MPMPYQLCPCPGQNTVHSTGLSRQNRHVMPGIVDRLAAPEAARMFGDDAPILTDDDTIGVGGDLDRPADDAR